MSNPMYLPTTSSWTFTGGKASVSVGANVVAAMTWPQSTTSRGEAVITGFTISGLANQPPTGAGVIQYSIASSAQGEVCWVARESTIQGLELYKRSSPGSQVVNNYTVTTGLATGTSLVRNGDTYDCTDSMARTVSNTYAGSVTPNAGIGLFNIGAQAQFEYVLIVTRLN